MRAEMSREQPEQESFARPREARVFEDAEDSGRTSDSAQVEVDPVSAQEPSAFNETTDRYQPSDEALSNPPATAEELERDALGQALGEFTTSNVVEIDPTRASDGSNPELSNQLFERHPNLREFNVRDVDFSDNPILDAFHNKGATPEDYEWLVSTFDNEVRPAIEAGATREDLELLDNERASESMRKLTGVHDAFLGGDPIRLEVRDNGTLNPIGGRHRIEMARQLGIETLVGEVRGRQQ